MEGVKAAMSPLQGSLQLVLPERLTGWEEQAVIAALVL
jgi:hypothetical protein